MFLLVMVFAGHNRDVFIGLFAKIGKIMERGKHLLMLTLCWEVL